MGVVELLNKAIQTLDTIQVSGKENMEKLIGVEYALEEVVQAITEVTNGNTNEEGAES